jgi:DNA repair protein RadC
MITLQSFERTPRLAEMKVSYRRERARRKTRETPHAIRRPIHCDTYLRKIWDKDTIDLREEFIVLCLNGAHEVLGWVKVATGGINSTPVDPRIIFGVALQTASSTIVVAHNHPSGSLTPSQADYDVTRALRAAGKLIGINVLDHLIITREGYFSFTDACWPEKTQS